MKMNELTAVSASCLLAQHHTSGGESSGQNAERLRSQKASSQA